MRYWLIIPVLFFGLSGISQAPVSWEYNGVYSFRTNQHQVELPSLSLFEQEDRKHGWDHRFAAKVDAEVRLFEDPDLHLADQHLIAIEQITVPSEKGFAVKVNIPTLEPGEQLFFYNNDGDVLAFFDGSRSRKRGTTHIIGPDVSSEWFVEYNASWWQSDPDPVEIIAVYPVYKKGFLAEEKERDSRDLGFGAAKPCHNNVNCPKAEDWQDEKRGVVRILIVLEQGMGWCSGSLVNNTSRDGTPYVLSAFHCIDGFDPDYEHWRFDFNYESASCQNPTSEPNYNHLRGCELVSGRLETDFLLVRLDEEVPVDYNAYFNGWNRRNNHLPSHGALIHHPRADIKKISFEDDPLSVFSGSIHWDNGVTTPPNSHYRAVLDDGIFEGGSSGSPFFDDEGLIIGQLHGGNASCSSNYTYNGRFSRSWNGQKSSERLIDWLDPESANPPELEGMENPASLLMVFSGNVYTPDNKGVNNVAISIDGEIETETSTDVNGFFFIEDIPSNGSYNLIAEKSGAVNNGVSALDIVLLRRHLLGLESFTEDYQWVAADVDQSGSVSAIDILDIRKVLLGIKDKFTAPSWIITPGVIDVDDPQAPEEVFEFTAIKTGDLNLSADPAN